MKLNLLHIGYLRGVSRMFIDEMRKVAHCFVMFFLTAHGLSALVV